MTVAHKEPEFTKSEIIFVSLSPASEIITALFPPNIDGLQLSAKIASCFSRNSSESTANKLSFSTLKNSSALSHNSSTNPASGPYSNNAFIFDIPCLISASFHFILFLLGFCDYAHTDFV